MDITNLPVITTVDAYLAHVGLIGVTVVFVREQAMKNMILQYAASAMNAFKSQASRKLIEDLFNFFAAARCTFYVDPTPRQPGGAHRNAELAVSALELLDTPESLRLAERLRNEMSTFDREQGHPLGARFLTPKEELHMGLSPSPPREE